MEQKKGMFSSINVREIATEVRRGDEVLARGYVVLACVNRDFRVTRLPEWMAEYCEKCLYPAEEQKK